MSAVVKGDQLNSVECTSWFHAGCQWARSRAWACRTNGIPPMEDTRSPVIVMVIYMVRACRVRVKVRTRIVVRILDRVNVRFAQATPIQNPDPNRSLIAINMNIPYT